MTTHRSPITIDGLKLKKTKQPQQPLFVKTVYADKKENKTKNKNKNNYKHVPAGMMA